MTHARCLHIVVFHAWPLFGTSKVMKEVDSDLDSEDNMDKLDDLPGKKRKSKAKAKPKAKMVKLSKLATKKKKDTPGGKPLTPGKSESSKAALKEPVIFGENEAPKTKWPTYTVPSGGWLVYNEKGNSYCAHCPLHGSGRCRANKVLTKEPMGYLLKWLEDAKNFNSGEFVSAPCQDVPSLFCLRRDDPLLSHT